MFDVLKNKIRSLDHRWLYLPGILLLFLIYLLQSGPLENPNPDPDISTMIPLGETLIPIQVLNEENLEGILQSYAYVKLFDKSKRPIAEGVRMLKSPLARKWAILVPDEFVKDLVFVAEGFFVTVQGQSQRNFKWLHPRDGLKKSRVEEMPYD